MTPRDADRSRKSFYLQPTECFPLEGFASVAELNTIMEPQEVDTVVVGAGEST